VSEGVDPSSKIVLDPLLIIFIPVFVEELKSIIPIVLLLVP